MDNKKSQKSWVKRIFIAVLIAEGLYVSLINLALQLPLTQTLINQIKPDKFHINWESAWTWYPFRIHVHKASGNGQSRSQQWEFELQSVSASIDILPLFFKRVRINDVRLSDASYYQRPRLKPDSDYSELIPYFPPISGREITTAVTTPLTKKRAWHVYIEDIRLNGQYRYWIQQFKGQAEGMLKADLDVVSRGGMLSMRIPDIRLELGPHMIRESRELFHHGVISGELEFTPFVPRENKGIRMLQYALIDTDIDIRVDSLDFIDLFTRKFEHLEINGTGQVDGHLRLDHGEVLDGTDLSIDADNLDVSLFSHNIKGNGALRIAVAPETGNQLDLDVRFDDMVVEQAGSDVPMLTGQGLALTASSGNKLLQIESNSASTERLDFMKKKDEVELQLKIPAARVTDMVVFNHYIPTGSPLIFTSGSAELETELLLKNDAADGFLKLRAVQAQAVIEKQQIQADFSADVGVVDGSLHGLQFDISGSEFRLDNVRVIGENETFNQKNWAATLMLMQAETTFSKPLQMSVVADIDITDSRPLVAMLGNKKDRPEWVKKMLTIEDVTGTAAMNFKDNKLFIPSAFMESDHIEFGAKGVFDRTMQDGVVYARYKRLDIVVKITGGEKNIDLIRARGKFEDYQLPGNRN